MAKRVKLLPWLDNSAYDVVRDWDDDTLLW
jgi:hypothetical protein